MYVPVIHGTIDRRILVNYRVEPEVLSAMLPAPFRPKLIHGMGMVGICLIRLKQIRPRFWPASLGLDSENAAHRAAVEWEQDGKVHEGVYVRRRDTSSRLNSLAGGRLFPGIHHRARFVVLETLERLEVAMHSNDGQTELAVRGKIGTCLNSGSHFRSLEEASEFFRRGSLGYSATATSGAFQGLELRCHDWRVEPMDVHEVRSNYFSNPTLFPPGSIEFDCALVMRNIAHEWHARQQLCAGCEPAHHRSQSGIARASA